jgi:hypothetical protein
MAVMDQGRMDLFMGQGHIMEAILITVGIHMVAIHTGATTVISTKKSPNLIFQKFKKKPCDLASFYYEKSASAPFCPDK